MLLLGPSAQHRVLEACPPISAGTVISWDKLLSKYRGIYSAGGRNDLNICPWWRCGLSPRSVEVTGMGFAWGNNDGFRLFLWPWWDEALCKPLGRKFHEGYNVPPRPGRKAALQLLGRNTWGNRRTPSPSALLCVGFPLPLPVDKSVLIQLCLSRCIHADFVW